MQAATVVINRRALRHNLQRLGCGGESERLWSRSS